MVEQVMKTLEQLRDEMEAKQLEQHHAQISIGYAPLLMQRARARSVQPTAASNPHGGGGATNVR